MARGVRGGLGYGEGTISQLATGRYRARWMVDGRQRSQSFETYRAARDHLEQVAEDKRVGRYVAPSEQTVADVVRDYLERGKSRWSANTYATYRQRAKVHIYPLLGKRKARQLDTPEVQWWVDRLNREKTMPETIAGAVSVLSGAYKEAVRLRIVTTNVVSGVRLPTIRRKQHTTWSIEDMRRVLHYLRGDERWHAVYRLMLMTGMRPGELRALRWSDIDLKQKQIHIERTITKDHQGRETVGTTTKTGVARVVAIPTSCVSALATWQLKQEHKRGYVFTGEAGQPLGHTTWTKAHLRMIAEINATLDDEDKVPVITLHEMRHSSATIELANGTPLKVVSERLGHRRTETTSNLYQHVDVTLQRAAANALEDRIEGRV